MRKIAVNGLIFLFALFSALLGAEVLLRSLGMKAPTYVTPKTLGDIDHLYEPGATARWCGNLGSIKAYDSVVKNNDKGLHDSNHTLAKPSDTYRILVLGDSFVEALQVDVKDTFFKKMESSLSNNPPERLRGKKIEVIALGRSGNGSIAELKDLTENGLQYEPDLVLVLVLDQNDFSDDLFRLSREKGLIRAPIQFENIQLYRELDYYNGLLILKSSWLNQWIAFYLTEKMREPRVRREKLDVYGRDLGIYAANDSQLFRDSRPAWEGIFKVTATNYLKMKQLANRSGADFRVVFIDNPFVYDAKKREQLYRLWPALRNEKLDFEAPVRRLKAVFDRSEVQYLDLNGPFQEYFKKMKRSLCFQYDGHWNERGHELGGTLIAGWLRKSV